MDAILRSIIIYLFLMLIFRISGKRSLAQITTFDFIMLIVIGQSSQQALLGNDFSLTDAFLVIATLLSVDIGISLLKQYVKPMGKWLDSAPLVIVEDGKLLKDRMNKARVDETDIMARARELQGLERLEQIKYAVLERSGGITIIPVESGR